MNLKSLVPWSSNDRGTSAVRWEMDRFFGDVFRGFDWPNVEVRDTGKEYKVIAELPGMEQRDIELTFADGVLTLKGEKHTEEETALYSERWSGAFERQIVLSDEVDPDHCKATFKNGVLTVVLGKKPEALSRVKRIEIN